MNNQTLQKEFRPRNWFLLARFEPKVRGRYFLIIYYLLKPCFMKKLFIIPIAVFGLFFGDSVFAQNLHNQDINLELGWNIISTPKVLESFNFSISNTVENFDIYVLNPESSSGWSTMADLDQSMFTPLYGYFINNKSGENQTLTFNYKQTSLTEELFERTFNNKGWYSIGVANSQYVLPVGASSVTDIDNPTHVLSSISGKYDTVIDFTDAQFAINKKSVAVTSPRKSANSLNINSLNDFRETKGYGIYIKEGNVSYIGRQEPLQNEAVPHNLDINIIGNEIVRGLDEQALFELELTTDAENITLYGFDLNINRINEGSGSNRLNRFIDQVQLRLNNNIIATGKVNNSGISFSDLSIPITNGNVIRLEIITDTYYSETDVIGLNLTQIETHYSNGGYIITKNFQVFETIDVIDEDFKVAIKKSQNDPKASILVIPENGKSEDFVVSVFTLENKSNFSSVFIDKIIIQELEGNSLIDKVSLKINNQIQDSLDYSEDGIYEFALDNINIPVNESEEVSIIVSFNKIEFGYIGSRIQFSVNSEGVIVENNLGDIINSVQGNFNGNTHVLSNEDVE